jgi:hypothetical protein
MADKDAAAELDKREADLATREAAFAERERQALHKESAAFCEVMVKEGRLPPGLAPSAVAIMGALAGGEVVEFAEASGETVKKPLIEVFRELLGRLPKTIHFEEFSASNQEERVEISGADPRRAAELGMQARTLQDREAKTGVKIDIAGAVRRLIRA